MRFKALTLLTLPFLCCIYSAIFSQGKPDSWILDSRGAVIRGDLAHKEIALIFVCDSLTDGKDQIQKTLKENNVRASFFLSTFFYKNQAHKPFIETLRTDDHYIGLYTDQEYAYKKSADSLVADPHIFKQYFHDHYKHFAALGIAKDDALFFLTPPANYNKQICDWAHEADLHLIQGSPGTLVHLDFKAPEDKEFRSSEEILHSILVQEKEHAHGLRGFLLVLNAGSHPQREDKFFMQLDKLIKELDHRGYTFLEINELLD